MAANGGAPRLVRKFVGHQGEVVALAPSADDAYLVSVSRDQTVSFWSVALKWATFPELGASFKPRAGKLVVDGVEPGSPLWQAGLSRDDEILLVRSAREEKGKAPELLYLYDDFPEKNAYGRERDDARRLKRFVDLEECLKKLKAPDPGSELFFVQKRPGDDKRLLRGAARVQQRPLWRFFPAFTPEGTPSEWVLWRWHDHVYDCSTNGDDLIGWQISSDEDRTPDYYVAASARERYWKPEVIRNTLLHRDWTPGHIARVLDLRPPDLALEVRDPDTGAPVTALPRSGKVKVVLRVRPGQARQNEQPDRVYLWVNDYRAWEWTAPRDRDPGPSFPREHEWSTTLDAGQLRFGLNRLTLQCYLRGDASGGTSATHQVELTRSGKAGRPRLFAVLVGVADYSQVRKLNPGVDAPDLKGCIQDIRLLTDTFQQKAGLFEEVHLTVLQDDQPVEQNASRGQGGPVWREKRGPVSRQAILDTLGELQRQVRPDDVLVFYLSGHGMGDGKVEQTFTFICPQFKLGKQAAETGVTGKRLYRSLMELPCHKLVLLDACHSGDVSTNPVRQLCLDGMGPVVISACKPDQSAISDDEAGSLFTQSVNEALTNSFKEADVNKDGSLDVEELKNYVSRQLQRQVDDLREQTKDPRKKQEVKQDLDYSPKDLYRTNFILLPSAGPSARR
jgi:hypothetical protein